MPVHGVSVSEGRVEGGGTRHDGRGNPLIKGLWQQDQGLRFRGRVADGLAVTGDGLEVAWQAYLPKISRIRR